MTNYERNRYRNNDEERDDREYNRSYSRRDRGFGSSGYERNYEGREYNRDYGTSRRNYGTDYDRDYDQGYGSSRNRGQNYDRDDQRGYGTSRYDRGYDRDYDRESDADRGYGTYGRNYGGDYDAYGYGYGSGYTSGSQYGARRGFGRSEYDRRTTMGGQYYGRGPQGYQRSDESIREDVNERLTWHGDVDATNIQVSVDNGEVTLEGTVGERRQKRAAEDAIEDVRGIKDIHNRLRVDQSLLEQIGQGIDNLVNNDNRNNR